MADPEVDHRLELSPQLAPRLRLEVERVDVLVSLWWVLRVLDRSVGAVAEPLGMLLGPRVVGRALIGQVQRDLEAMVARGLHQVVEVLERPQFRMDCRVSALRPADCPRTAGIVALGPLAVV